MGVSTSRPPIPPTALIGREGEIARVRGLLLESRLVTLTGSGGSGKTRIAVAVLCQLDGEYADGAAFVDLAPLAEAGLLAAEIASTLGVPETGVRSLEETLTSFLSRRELLLCL